MMFEYDDFTDKQKVLYGYVMSEIPVCPFDWQEREMFAKNAETLISGVAGAGKTTLVALLIRDLIRRGYKVFVTSPTHKATAAMVKSYGSCKEKPAFIGTIHSALGLKLQPMENSEEMELVDSGFSRTSQTNRFNNQTQYFCDVMVVDESSMISTDLKEKIIARCEKEKIHVIFIGDKYQVQPVDGDGSISDVFDIKSPTIMDEVTRQAADNPVIKFTAACRAKIDYAEGKGANFNFKFSDYIDNEHLEMCKIADAAEKYLSWIDGKPENAEKFKFVSFLNSRVDKFNEMVRRRLYGKDAPKFIEGEILTMQGSTESLCNNQEVKVELVEEVSEYVEAPYEIDEKGNVHKYTEREFECWKLQVVAVDNPELTETIRIIKDSEIESFVKFKKALSKHYKAIRSKVSPKASKTGWNFFWDFSAMFVEVKPSFAVTVHKSQGSTYEKAILDVSSMKLLLQKNPKSGFRLLYVGSSRAKEKTYFATT